MKKITKAALALAGTAAAAGAFVYAACDIADSLIVDRTKVVPQGLSSKVSGSDMSHLAELCAKNMQWLESYGYEKHYITSDRGEKLVGYLMKPEKPSDVYVFCAHGYRSDGKREYCGFAQYYLAKGFNVFFPDHTAAGESEGQYAGFGAFECADSLKWLGYLIDTFGKDIVITLHGVSMGAATVMMMSGSENLPENVKMIVSDCGYTSAWEEFDYKLEEMKIPARTFILNTVNRINKKKAGYDFKSIQPVESVKNAKVPMLFVHGSGDNFVPCFMAHLVYEACKSEYKDLLIVEGAGHAQCSVDGWDEYKEKLDEFIGKFVTDEVKA